MTTITDTEGDKKAATSWNTLQVIIFALGLGVSLFLGGMRVGGLGDVADKLEADELHNERVYVRKDGRELAELRGDIKSANDKLDLLLRKEGLLR